MNARGDRAGAAVSLANLVNEGLQADASSEPPEGALEVRPAAAPARRAQRPAPARSEPGGWAGPVPRTKVDRDPLNVGMPRELDIPRRLRRYSADSGVDIQDFVAASLHDALDALGYGLPKQAHRP